MISSKGTPPTVALIGVSGYASVYVDWLLEAHQSKLLHIAAISVLPSEKDKPQVKQILKRGAKLFHDYAKLFAETAGTIDLCYIPTGIQWHARMTIAALESGCNVLVEKPLAGSILDVDRVRKVEQQTGRWIAVGFQDMYTEEIADLKHSLVSGEIGEIQAIAMVGAWPRAESYYARNQWAGRLQADGAQVLDSPLNNAFAHFINLSLYLASPEEHQSSKVTVNRRELYRAHDIESFDTAVVTAHSDQGVKFWFGVSHACQDSIEPTIRIIGSKGHVTWTHEDKYSVVSEDSLLDERPVPKYATTRSKMFENVLSRLTYPQARICDTSIAQRHTEFIEQIHRGSEIRTIAANSIERVESPDGKSFIPAINSIESRLQAAFQSLEPLGEFETQPTNA